MATQSMGSTIEPILSAQGPTGNLPKVKIPNTLQAKILNEVHQPGSEK